MTDEEALQNKRQECNALQFETLKYAAVTFIFIAESVFGICTDSWGIALFSFVAFLVSKHEFERYHDESRVCLNEYKRILKRIYPEEND